jgi:ribosomal protein L12E/L44/L45/RPP1/RPP2
MTFLKTKMTQKAYKLVIRELKMICDVFDVDRFPSTIDKDELIERLLEFLSAPNAKLTNAGGGGGSAKKKSAPKKKKGKKKQGEEETEDEESESEKEEEGKMPSDKALKNWVKAYVSCFNMDNVTIKHAIETASDKFGVDLTEKKGFIKKLLTESM